MWPRLMPGELLRNKRCVHGGIIMERITGGSVCVIPVVGIRCVHYIEQKDCAARFAIQGLYERFPIEKEAGTGR